MLDVRAAEGAGPAFTTVVFRRSELSYRGISQPAVRRRDREGGTWSPAIGRSREEWLVSVSPLEYELKGELDNPAVPGPSDAPE